jgi:hypothetical protein
MKKAKKDKKDKRIEKLEILLEAALLGLADWYRFSSERMRRKVMTR